MSRGALVGDDVGRAIRMSQRAIVRGGVGGRCCPAAQRTCARAPARPRRRPAPRCGSRWWRVGSGRHVQGAVAAASTPVPAGRVSTCTYSRGARRRGWCRASSHRRGASSGGVLIAAHRLTRGGVQPGEAVDPAAAQDLVGGRGCRHTDAGGDLDGPRRCSSHRCTIFRLTGSGVVFGLRWGREERSNVPAGPSAASAHRFAVRYDNWKRGRSHRDRPMLVDDQTRQS